MRNLVIILSVLIGASELSGQEYSGNGRSLTIHDTCLIKGIYAVGYQKIPKPPDYKDRIEISIDSKRQAFFIPFKDSRNLDIEDLKTLLRIRLSDSIFLDYWDSELLYYVKNGGDYPVDRGLLNIDSIANKGKPIEIGDYAFYIVRVEVSWVRIDVPPDSSDLITEANGNKYSFVRGDTTKVFYPIKLLKAKNLRLK